MELIIFLAIVTLILISVLSVIALYNTLVKMRNSAKNAFSQIEVQLKRRHDLIPNLIETVKGYMDHERETLLGVTQARNAAMNARTLPEKKEAEGALSETLTKFFAVAENYPQLQANENFLALQEALVSTENKIAFARQYYNDEVMQYNTKVEQFPANIIAGMFNFRALLPFELTNATEREAPKVSFGR